MKCNWLLITIFALGFAGVSAAHANRVGPRPFTGALPQKPAVVLAEGSVVDGLKKVAADLVRCAFEVWKSLQCPAGGPDGVETHMAVPAQVFDLD